MSNDITPDRASMTLHEEIRYVINLHSRENESDTPDFLLADFLMACLAAFEKATTERDAWYGTSRWHGTK